MVGAGPGDPDLLTVKALRLIQTADCIIYDRLVSEEILALANPTSEMLYVGKQRSEHSVPQSDINALLVSKAKSQQSVVRLKGGDPFIFGRGGEEIAELASNRIDFEVVPGVTAATGCSSYAGIPLTHRDFAQSVRFVTGHLKNGRTNITPEYCANPSETLVFYMGLLGLSDICKSLVDVGRDPATPAALIQQGTTSSQKVIVGQIDNLAELVATSDVQAPTLIIVGRVVSLRKQLKWFKPN